MCIWTSNEYVKFRIKIPSSFLENGHKDFTGLQTLAQPLINQCYFWIFRYGHGQFDPYDRPQASLGYNMDDSEFANDYGRPQMDDSYNQLYSQTRTNGHSDYYGYGNR